eukprot:9475507-Pyramimonas_sp.AAC.1
MSSPEQAIAARTVVDIDEVVAKISQEDRFDNSRNKFEAIGDLLPDLQGADVQTAVDKMYLLVGNVKINFASKPNGEGEWLHLRDPLNDRGDECTVDERKRSIETKGIYSGVRSGAWVRPQENVVMITPETKMWFMHWASLMEGCEKARDDPANKTNSMVCNAVNNGISQCKVYRHDMPDYVVKYLVGLGNDTNGEASTITFLQIYRSSATAQSSWVRKAKAQKWTNKGLGQGALERERASHVDKVFKGPERWPTIKAFERCYGFFRDAQKIIMPTGESLWVACDRIRASRIGWVEQWEVGVRAMGPMAQRKHQDGFNGFVAPSPLSEVAFVCEKLSGNPGGSLGRIRDRLSPSAS